MSSPISFRLTFGFFLRQTCAITFGALLTAISINLFLVPLQFVTGGISGLALLIHYVAPIPIWAWILLFNAPVFVAGFLILGRGFLVASFYGTLALTLFVYLTEPLAQLKIMADPMLAAIFGGVVSEVGIGITLRLNGSLGGTDIIGAIVKKLWSINVGTTIFTSNALIIIAAGFIFGTEVAAFALINIFVEALLIDKTMKGFDTSQALMIISSKPEEIADYIMKHINRGVTFLQGEGAYQGRHVKVLYCVVSLRQVARVKLFVKQIDPAAFMTIENVIEVMGEGFRPSPF